MLYFLALLCLSSSPNWAKLNQMPSEVLGFWRLSLAAFILILFQTYKKSFTLLRFKRENIWVFISAFFFFLHLWTFKYAAKNTSIANMTVLYASNPIWSSFGAIIFFNEKPHLRTYISFLIAFGAILFLFSQNMSFEPQHNLGNLMAISSAVLYAVYMLTGKKARKNISNQIYATHQYLISGLFFLLAALFITKQNVFESYSTTSWIAVAGLIIFPTFLGHFILTHLVSTMDIAVMTCGKLVEPVIASIMAYFLFKETLSSSIIISFSLMIISIIILFWPQLKRYIQQTTNKPVS